ncbi:MAG: LLM class flavin-dependent oxidoreductase [Chromatiales bacterium]|jgi:FMN-dependent oxidoreductase (nitrilotriacetate monooxygenase family)|nr:LLM class flavin-dependent oxidoreductase [Chromatiales bacterium]
MSDRQMVLVGFLQAQNCSNYPASWRHPQSAQDFLSPKFYQRIARTLEDGKFHLAFFDDRLAMPDIYGNDHAESVRNGVRVVKMDPVPIMAAMGAVTSKLGLGATCSTTYYEPFHVARTFATLDLMTEGRAGWNVVTSLNDSEARNMGADGTLEHDTRYDRADEFMEVVLGHWAAWQPDALVVDRDSGVFADPDKVSRLDHQGTWFKSRGPFTVPPSAQRHPVVIQAGQSGRGRQFALKWGELIFAIIPTLELGQRLYAEMREEAVAMGRDPDSYRIAPAIYCTVAESQSIAQEKAALIESLAKPIDTLALLSEALNFDFGSKAMDDPFSDEELASISGLHAIRDRVIRASGKRNPTVADFVTYSGRGTVKEIPHFIGTPERVADELQAWFEGRACDGFVLAATHVPGAYEEFVRLVVPELQRRGLHQNDYQGTTLRENLGLPGFL